VLREASIGVVEERKTVEKGRILALNAGDLNLSRCACGVWDDGIIGDEWREFVQAEQSGLGGEQTVGRRRSSSWEGLSQDGSADGR
jgi:hypothetical protein